MYDVFNGCIALKEAHHLIDGQLIQKLYGLGRVEYTMRKEGRFFGSGSFGP